MDTFIKSVVPMIKDFVKMPNKDGLDYDGDIIFYGDNIYRAIKPIGEDNMLTAIDNGLISELQEKKLIPKTKIAPFILPGYSFVFQHEKVKNVSYAFEWSFTMFQDAALMELDVLDTLVSHGFTSKDAHSGNILFNNNHPLWVDLTSFIKMPLGRGYFNPALEFFNSIFLPLEIMSENPLLMRRISRDNGYNFQTKFFLNLAAKFGAKRQHLFPALFRRYITLTERMNAETEQEKIFRITNAMRQKIRKLKLNYYSDWATYQNNWVDSNRNVILNDGSSRYLKVHNIIASLPIKSVVELAANQGMFSAILAENSNIEKIVAIDIDEQAVDIMYKLLSRGHLSANCVRKIFPMIVDFRADDYENLYDRVRGDAVVVMAMTHHLLLSQYMSIKMMFHRFSRFINRFIFVEFMPLGLWDGIHKSPTPPSWYTEAYFVENMEKYFRVLMRLQLEKNRVLFVGELK